MYRNLIKVEYDNPEVTYQINKLSDNKVKVTVFWGEKPNSGYRIRIKEVAIVNEELKVIYSKCYPDEDGIYKQVITYPSDSWEGIIDAHHEAYMVTLLSE